MSRSPAPTASPAPPVAPTQRSRFAGLRAWLLSLPDRPIAGRFISAFASLWPLLLKWLWPFFVTVLAGVLVILLTTPQGSKNGPQSWFLAPYYGWMLWGSASLIALSACSFVSVRLKHAAEQAAERREQEEAERAPGAAFCPQASGAVGPAQRAVYSPLRQRRLSPGYHPFAHCRLQIRV